MFNNFYLIVVLSSAISSLNTFRLDLPRPYKYFSAFLFFSFLAEMAAICWPRMVKDFHFSYSPENHWIYNLYMIPAYLFYIYFYQQLLQSERIKILLKILAPLFLLFGLYNLFFAQGLYVFNTHTVLFAGFVVVFLTLAYFYQILSDKKIILLTTNPLFWISTGAFLFHLTTMLGLFFIVFLNNWYGKAAHVTAVIIKIASIMMYLNYSIAFLCQKKT